MRNNPTNGNWIYDSSNVQALPPPFPPNHRPSIQVTLLLALNYHPHYYYVSFRAGCFLFFFGFLFLVQGSRIRPRKTKTKCKSQDSISPQTKLSTRLSFLALLWPTRFLNSSSFFLVTLLTRPGAVSSLLLLHSSSNDYSYYHLSPLFFFPFSFLFKLSGFQLLEFRIIWFNRLCSLLLLSEERGENEEEQVEEEEDFAVSFLVC